MLKLFFLLDELYVALNLLVFEFVYAIFKSFNGLFLNLKLELEFSSYPVSNLL